MSNPKDYVYDKGVGAVWVVGSYEGARAKSVIAHANAGIGYIMLNENNNRNHPACMVAFRYPTANGPVPPHLDEVKDPAKISEYEKIRKGRQ